MLVLANSNLSKQDYNFVCLPLFGLKYIKFEYVCYDRIQLILNRQNKLETWYIVPFCFCCESLNENIFADLFNFENRRPKKCSLWLLHITEFFVKHKKISITIISIALCYKRNRSPNGSSPVSLLFGFLKTNTASNSLSPGHFEYISSPNLFIKFKCQSARVTRN